jgi:hypothetical protein
MRPEDVEQWTGQGKYSIPSPALDCNSFGIYVLDSRFFDSASLSLFVEIFR